MQEHQPLALVLSDGVQGNEEARSSPSPRICGELAIVPPHSEMQLTQLPDPYAPQSTLSSYGPLAIPGVCPACHRPLNNFDTDSVHALPSKRRFTPQYFRALVQSQTKHLSICDSPSFFSEQTHTRTTSSPIQRQVFLRQQNEQGSGVENEEELTGEAGVRATFEHEPMRDSDVSFGRTGDGSGCGSSGYYKQYFREIQKLGNGTFGGVYLCQHVMENVPLGYFALKKIPVGDNVEYLQKVLHEVRILEEVKRHPNVIEYNHSWVDTAQTADFGPPVRCLFILMEYANWGTLDTFLENYGEPLSTNAVWYLFLSALAGIAHLHQKDILHRDLKPQNLLLTGQRGGLPRVLVSDFGTAALLSELSYERTGGTGTMEYMAPELLECDVGNNGTYMFRHTKATDVWALGMILHYLAFNRTLPVYLPGGDLTWSANNASPPTRPPEMLRLIQAMLHRNPEKRPTCRKVLKSTVVQTILRSFDRTRVFSDVFSTTSTPATASAPSFKENVGEPDLIQVDWVSGNERTASHPQDQRYAYNEEKKVLCPRSPLAEVPLMLQYKKQEGKRDTFTGSRELFKGPKKTTVDRAVQTDYVKIVYE